MSPLKAYEAQPVRGWTAQLQRHLVPGVVLALGILSICFLTFTFRITERHFSEQLPLANLVDEVVLGTTDFHLRLERFLSGDATADIDRAWASFEKSVGLSGVLLSGGTDGHGNVIGPPADPEARILAVSLNSLLLELGAVAEQRLQAPESGGMGSALHQRFDDAFVGVVREGGRLESLVVEELDRSLDRSRRLFWTLLATWSAIVVIAAAGLWSWKWQSTRTKEVLEESRELQQAKERLEEWTRRLTLLHEAGLSMASEMSVEGSMQAIVDRARELAGARYGAFGMYGADGRMELFLTSGLDEETRKKIGQFPTNKGQMGRLGREGRPVRVSDLGQHPESVGFPPNHPHMKSFLGVPIISRGSATGTLYLADKQGAEEFSQEDEDLLVLMASQASLAIENTRSYGEVEKRKDHLATINNLSAALNSTLDMDQVLEMFFREVQGQVKADRMSIALADEAGENLVIHAMVTRGEPTLAKGVQLPLQGTRVAHAMNLGAPAFWPDLEAEETRFAEDEGLMKEGIRSVLTVPLIHQGRAIGSLNLGSAEVGAHSETDLELLSPLAKHATAAIVNARMYGALDQAYVDLEAAQEELRRSVERYRDIFNSASDLVQEIDAFGNLLNFNRRHLDLLGYSREELTGANIADLVVPEFRADAKALLEQFVRTGVIDCAETEFVAKDGRRVNVEINANAKFNQGGRFLLGRCYIRDTTRRMEAEAEVRRLAHAVEIVGEGVTVRDLEGRIQFVNRAWKEMMGWSREELIGKSPGDRNQPAETLVRLSNAFQEALQIGIWRGDVPGMTKDGREIFIAASVTPLKDENGRSIGLVTVSRDVTLQKQQETELRRLALAVANIGDNVAVTDLEGRITFTNMALAITTGYSERELLGRHADLLSAPQPEGGPELAGMFETALTTGRWEGELVSRRKDGTLYPSRVTLTPIMDEAGEPTGMVSVGRDLTEQKLTEQRLLDASRLVSIGELAAGVAHELNNPLSGVVGFSELLLDRPEVHGEAREMVQIVGEEARRAATIVQNLLTFARRREPERREVSVNEVVESALQISDYELKVHNIAIEKDLSSDPVTAPLDRQQILQVFLNLIGNAQQAMHAATGEGTLRISSRADGDNIKVTFRDNGPGISETARSKILEPFFTTKEVGSGTGLGLSIALGIVTQHGGRLYAENGHGEGTGFVVELPGQWPDEMPVPQGTTVTRRERTVKSGNILVVDDERTIRKVLAIALTEDGHQVDTVGDGHAALERLKNQSYDVLFVDLRMPGMDGERLFKVLRQQYPDAARKVVFITGDTTSPDSQEFLEKTGRPFLAKPMTLSEVRGLAQEILEAE